MPGFGSFEFVVPDLNPYGAETALAWESEGKGSSYSLNTLLLFSGAPFLLFSKTRGLF